MLLLNTEFERGFDLKCAKDSNIIVPDYQDIIDYVDTCQMIGGSSRP